MSEAKEAVDFSSISILRCGIANAIIDIIGPDDLFKINSRGRADLFVIINQLIILFNTKLENDTIIIAMSIGFSTRADDQNIVTHRINEWPIQNPKIFDNIKDILNNIKDLTPDQLLLEKLGVQLKEQNHLRNKIIYNWTK